MTVAQMRAEILKVYPGDAWKKKVSKMPDDQVIAIYYKFLQSGKFNQKPKTTHSAPKTATPRPARFEEVTCGEQISFFN